jgi:hypothetical protein
MNGETHLIVTTGGISQTQFVGDLDVAAAPNGLYTFSLSVIIDTSTPFPCNDPNIVTLVGGTIEIPNADLNSIANIVGWDANTCEITVDNPIAWSGFVSSSLVYITYTISDIVQAYVDLYPLESISQNFNFQDVGSFAPLGDFTREFRVPASDRNLEIFGLLDSFTFSDSANIYGTKIPAEIRVDTLPIIRGHVRVIKTFKRNDQLADIQISFYGEAPDLFRSIGDKLLTDIEYLPTLDCALTYDNVTNPPLPTELVFGLVDRGQKWSNAGAGRPVSNSTQPIYSGELTPFVNAWTLFSNIINEAGFTLSPTPLETILSGYWCPWLMNKNLITQETVQTYYFNAGFTTNTPVPDNNPLNFPELVDNGGQYATFAFQAPVAGYYTFRAWLNVIPVGTFGPSTGGLKMYRWTTGSPTAGSLVVNHDVAISGNDQNNGVLQSVLITTIPIFMEAGQYIRCYTEFSGTPIFQGNATNDPLTGSGWELFNFVGLYGVNLNTAANAPNIKQVDFVRDILNMHAAVVVPSRTTPNEVGIIPIADYIGTGDDIDWTQKLDISKDITLSPTTDIQRRNFLFSYKNGGDYYSKIFTDNGRTFGQYQILDGYSVSEGAPVNEFVTGDLNIKLVAESTPAVYIEGTQIPIPKFINDKGDFVAPNLRFLFLADVATVQVYNDGASSVDSTAVNVFNNYSSVNASIGDYDLNFAPETPLHNIITNPFRNLFNEYWRDYLNGLYSPETRILEAYFALDLADIMTFKYNDRIWIKDSYWRILEITDFKIGLYESVKVKLIKIVDPAPDCALVPVAVAVTDAVQVVEFEDFEGNPQPSTQTCCVRYGYFWDDATNQCLALGTPIVTDTGGGTDTFAAIMYNAGVDGAPSNVLARTANTTIDVGNGFSVYAGESMTIERGNQNTLAVGERLKMEGANRGSVLLGRNAYSNIMGLHYGGGDRVSNNEGNQQTGIIVLSNGANFVAAGQYLEIATGTDVINRINLPNGTAITAGYTLHASDVAGNWFYETGSLYIEKVGGVAAFNAPIVITTANSGAFTFALGIDVVTNPAEHRFGVVSAGAGFPLYIQVILTLNYTQTR